MFKIRGVVCVSKTKVVQFWMTWEIQLKIENFYDVKYYTFLMYYFQIKHNESIFA